MGGAVAFTLYALNQDLRSNFSHSSKRLPDCGEAGHVIGGLTNVIKPDYRDVFGHAQSSFSNCPDRTDGGDVVVRKQRGEVVPSLKQIFR